MRCMCLPQPHVTICKKANLPGLINEPAREREEEGPLLAGHLGSLHSQFFITKRGWFTKHKGFAQSSRAATSNSQRVNGRVSALFLSRSPMLTYCLQQRQNRRSKTVLGPHVPWGISDGDRLNSQSLAQEVSQ